MTLEEYREFLESIEGVEYLTVEEAAKLLRTSEGAICKAIHDGALPTMILGERGKTWRIWRHDLPKLAVLCGDSGHARAEAQRQVRLSDQRPFTTHSIDGLSASE